MITSVNPIIVYFKFAAERTQARRDLAARAGQPTAAWSRNQQTWPAGRTMAAG
jgi:hypothetical protein